MNRSTPVALTIAGFDPTGGAGVLADAGVFTSLGLQPAGVITSVTFQSSSKFFGAAHQTAETVRAQLEPLLQHPIACAKTGMLPTREIVLEVARLFRESHLPRPVVDPVMISSSGFRLMAEDALAVFIAELTLEAALVTPNVPEAEILAEMTIRSEADMVRAAAIIREKGATAVLIKGGHLGDVAGGRSQEAESKQLGIAGVSPAMSAEQAQCSSPGSFDTDAGETPAIQIGLSTVNSGLETAEVIDVLDNDGRVTVFRESRIPGAQLHGSGCILSAAIAAGLGKGMTLEASIAKAKRYVLEKLAQTQRSPAN